MTPKRGKETLLQLCTRATLLGNSISIRMLEYLSTIKAHPDGFRELAADFLDTCRILWSIEAGLTEASMKQSKFPTDMVQELESKFRQTIDIFIVLEQIILKDLESERKGTIGRLQKGWRKMFASTDLDKMRAALVKCRDALRMSSMVFRWAIGDDKADSAAGIGYTGLMAALDRMNRDQSTTVIRPASTASPRVVNQAPQSSASSAERSNDLALLRAPSERRTSMTTAIPSVPALSPGNSHATTSPTLRSLPRTPGIDSPSIDFWKEKVDTIASAETESIGSFIFPKQFERVYPNLSAVPRWTARGSYASNSAGSKAALSMAIDQRDHKNVEKLLDSGVGADTGIDVELFNKACAIGDSESIRLLLLFGADANGVDAEKDTPLLCVTRTGFIDGAKLLLKYGADPNFSAGPDMSSALMAAVQDNNIELTHQYLMYGGDASQKFEHGNTVLISAITKTTSSQLLELILKFGGDVNVKNSEGQTALFIAIQIGRVDIMSLLLDHGAQPNLPAPKHPLWPSTYNPEALRLMLSKGADPKKTPGIMELAASIKKIESIKILLEHGVSPNIKKDGIYTPLCSSIRDDSAEIFSLLLASGADPNLPASEYPAFKCVTHKRLHFLPQLIAAGSDLSSPKGIIETAVAHNNQEALIFLLDQGVNPNDRTPTGETALTTAIRDGRSNFVDILLARGANPGVRGEDWPISMAVKRPPILKKLLAAKGNPTAVRGVLELAVSANELESIKMLLKAGVNVEDKTGGVFSPLTTAIREDKKDLVRFLLDEAGADPNKPGEHLPIIKAIRRCLAGDTSIIEMLLERGADINQMYRGWNAILQAVESGDSKILNILLEKGGPPDLWVTDENGRAVIDIVTERGWDEAMTILLASSPSKYDSRSSEHLPTLDLSSHETAVAL